MGAAPIRRITPPPTRNYEAEMCRTNTNPMHCGVSDIATDRGAAAEVVGADPWLNSNPASMAPQLIMQERFHANLLVGFPCSSMRVCNGGYAECSACMAFSEKDFPHPCGRVSVERFLTVLWVPYSPAHLLTYVIYLLCTWCRTRCHVRSTSLQCTRHVNVTSPKPCMSPI